MAESYSFSDVSNFDRQELVNAVDQVRREVAQRYDLKDSGTEISLEEASLTITTASDMTLQAVEDALRQKATKCNLSLKIFDFHPTEAVGGIRRSSWCRCSRGRRWRCRCSFVGFARPSLDNAPPSGFIKPLGADSCLTTFTS